jgi:hypothetical protein
MKAIAAERSVRREMQSSRARQLRRMMMRMTTMRE